MAETPDLAQVIADAREEAQVLRRAGNPGQADYIDALIDRVRNAGEDYATWLSESQAMIKSGLEARTLRSHFRWLKSCRLARYGQKQRREYLACAIPQRADTVARFQEGLERPA